MKFKIGILCNEDLNFVKTKTKEGALSSYRNYTNNVLQHLFKEACVEIKISLSKNQIRVILL